MKAIKKSHAIFPNGRGIVIIDQYVTLLCWSGQGEWFHIWSTMEPIHDIADLDKVLDTIDKSDGTHGASQAADLRTILTDCGNDELGAMFEAFTNGSNPFQLLPHVKDIPANRKLCIDYLTTCTDKFFMGDEAIKEEQKPMKHDIIQVIYKGPKGGNKHEINRTRVRTIVTNGGFTGISDSITVDLINRTHNSPDTAQITFEFADGSKWSGTIKDLQSIFLHSPMVNLH